MDPASDGRGMAGIHGRLQVLGEPALQAEVQGGAQGRAGHGSCARAERDGAARGIHVDALPAVHASGVIGTSPCAFSDSPTTTRAGCSAAMRAIVFGRQVVHSVYGVGYKYEW